MKPLLSLFRFAFGCRHNQKSAVFTIKKRTYQVCLSCGHELEYSWKLMQATRSGTTDHPNAALDSVQRPKHLRSL